MLIAHLIVAIVAVGAVALRPRSAVSTCVVGLAGAVDLLLGAPAVPALTVIAPLVAFLAAALTLAALVERSGLAERAAHALAAAARGSSARLYVLVCVVCGLLTAAVSLDGAVVLMVPMLVVLARRSGAAFAPLFLGAVAVANAASIAVPQGNPTNLVIINRLGLSATAFAEHMLGPGIAAAAICAGAVALSERRALAAALSTQTRLRTPLSSAERRAVISLAVAAAVAWTAPLAGIAPWWPFVAAVAVAVAAGRERPGLIVPWRIAVQVGGLLIVTQSLGFDIHAPVLTSFPMLLAISASTGAVAAVANNLPVSVWASGLLTAAPGAYATSIGLAVGSLATPQGSVATMIASQLAGDSAPSIPARRFVPVAAAGVLTATLLLWPTL